MLLDVVSSFKSQTIGNVTWIADIIVGILIMFLIVAAVYNMATNNPNKMKSIYLFAGAVIIVSFYSIIRG